MYGALALRAFNRSRNFPSIFIRNRFANHSGKKLHAVFIFTLRYFNPPAVQFLNQ